MLVTNEPRKIGKCKSGTVGTTAATVDLNGNVCRVVNKHASNTLYIKEYDGEAVTTATGYPIAPGATSEEFLSEQLSLIAGGASTGYAIIIFE